MLAGGSAEGEDGSQPSLQSKEPNHGNQEEDQCQEGHPRQEAEPGRSSIEGARRKQEPGIPNSAPRPSRSTSFRPSNFVFPDLPPPQYRFPLLFISCIDFQLLVQYTNVHSLLPIHIPPLGGTSEITREAPTTTQPFFSNGLFTPLHCNAPFKIFLVFAPFVVPHNTHTCHPANPTCSSPTLSTFFKDIAEIYATYEIYEAGKISKKTPSQTTRESKRIQDRDAAGLHVHVSHSCCPSLHLATQETPYLLLASFPPGLFCSSLSNVRV